jgi:fermentation-respiration switch protein FrsA (DUF1100 family)
MDTSAQHISFQSAGETLAGTLFTPAGAGQSQPGVVVAGGQTCVKEQMAGRYAERLAGHGFAALAFDFRGFGESGGAPRDYESPARKVEDLRNALAFLGTLPAVDPGRLAVLGIGTGAAYAAVAAVGDRRVRALALVAPGLQDPEIVRDRYGSDEEVARRTAEGEAARRRYEQTGQVDTVPVVSPTDPPAMTGYFLNPDRGGVPQWSNRFAVMSWPEWLAFDPISAAQRVTAPTLMVHSEGATQPDGAHRFFARLAGPKAERWTDGTQFDFYDRDTQVDPSVAAVADHLRNAFAA